MNYTLMCFESPTSFAARNHPDARQREAYWNGIRIYLKALRDAGVFVGGAGLELPETATTLHLDGGQPRVQDGPYADTKEQLGGFFMVDVPDRDAALAWAARCPAWPGRVMEVRANLVPME